MRPPVTDEFSLEQVVLAAIEPYRATIRSREIEILLDIPLDVPDHLAGDAQALDEILRAAMAHAVGLTSTGEIHIKVELLRTTGRVGLLRFAVRDTGCGVTHEQANHLLRNGMAHHVEKLGGQIAVSSAPGASTTIAFTARFPVMGSRDPSLFRLGDMRVLVADHRESARQFLRQTLKTWNLVVSVCSSAEDTIKRVRHATAAGAPFDLILFNADMPGVRNPDLEDRIGATDAGGFIAMAHDATPSPESRTAKTETLGKPVTPATLLNAILRHQESTRPVRPLEGARILLVEDIEYLQTVTGAALAREGCTVTVAGSGAEALALVQREMFDAVLMDIQMAGMDGVEATRRIRELPQGQGLPIIAMTADLAHGRRECLAAGMNDHIGKPFDPAALMTMLAKWARSRFRLAGH